MSHHPFYIIVFLIFIYGCNGASNQKPEEPENVTEEITSNDIESLRYDDYTLSNDSEKALENWVKYHELNEQMEYLKKGDFTFLIGEKKILKAFINDFKVEMPETIKTAPILSRITVLETKLLKLSSTLKLDNIDKVTKLGCVKELLIAMSNLNLQINKKFEFDANLVDKDANVE